MTLLISITQRHVDLLDDFLNSPAATTWQHEDHRPQRVFLQRFDLLYPASATSWEVFWGSPRILFREVIDHVCANPLRCSHLGNCFPELPTHLLLKAQLQYTITIKPKAVRIVD